MFGYVVASMKELEKPLQERYKSVYCGICRQIRLRSSGASRMVLSYDMAFLALLHMSLYEPQERQGKDTCFVHPLRPRTWVDNEYIRYAADMNVVLAYFNARDDWEDERRFGSKWIMSVLGSIAPGCDSSGQGSMRRWKPALQSFPPWKKRAAPIRMNLPPPSGS